MKQRSGRRSICGTMILVLAGWMLWSGCGQGGEEKSPSLRLLNVSYDPTRELYHDINAAFVTECASDNPPGITVEQSHGGSGKQARAVLDGLEADVVTLALGYDIDMLATRGKLLPEDWQTRLPYRSVPFYSTIVFLVRSGNPKHITDWDDLIRPGIEVITPNPKTSGGARWNYLAAYAWAKKTYGTDRAAFDYLVTLFSRVPVLDTGARGATNTFTRQRKGDVLIAWENEALQVILGRKQHDIFEIVYPSMSIKAEAPVALIDRYADAHGTRAQAERYLQFLYSPVGQMIAARHFYRLTAPTYAKAADSSSFRDLPMVTIEGTFGSWTAAHETHFADGALFDRILAARKAR